MSIYLIKYTSTNKCRQNKHTHIRAIGLTSRFLTNGLCDHASIPDQVISCSKNSTRCCLSWHSALLGSRVKWSNPGNGVALPPIPTCNTYWKRSPTLLLLIYISLTPRISWELYTVTRVQIRYEAFFYSAYTFGKGMNPIIPSPAVSKM